MSDEVMFVVGEEFSSFESFKTKLQRYSEENYCELYIVENKTTANAAKSLTIRFSVAYTRICVHAYMCARTRNDVVAHTGRKNTPTCV